MVLATRARALAGMGERVFSVSLGRLGTFLAFAILICL